MAGGWSGEREISIKSGETVFGALDKGKYNISRFDLPNDLESLIKVKAKIDLAFVLLHGKLGEDGGIQGFLDLLSIPFVGSGVLASAIAFNKKVAKGIYKGAGMEIVKDIILNRSNNISPDRIYDEIGPSTVVKPVSEGSSLGISVCHNKDELMEGIEIAFQYDNEVMVEQYINGREVTCCVIGVNELETLPIVEIIPDQSHDFFDFEAKYIPGITNEICPADLEDDLRERIENCAKVAHRSLNCRVWSRTDMIIEKNNIFLLETNTIPGMTENSLVPLSARAAGISLANLLDRIIELSLE